ncbi:MAG TPA: diacylglycerol kinase family protein [Candidatus Udaeobacter sp.]|nr:diacylglycerol kinase family protein [Candidatus Udaeobacter sp.]
MKVTLIHNPDAGNEEQPSAQEILDLIREAGHAAVYQSAKDENWHSALENPGDIVTVAGGDGMVGKVAKRLIGRNIPIAVLPLGTANNIANTLGLVDKPLDQLIAGWTAARRLDFDVGIANAPWGSSYFIEAVGVGLFADTMSRLNARSNIDLAHANDADEKISSVLEMLNERLHRCRAMELKAALDGQDLSGEYILVEAMNIRTVGPNLYLSPEADPGDGLLDIICVSTDEQDKLSRYFAACLEGKSCSLGLTARRGTQLQIEWQGFRVHIDDEAWPSAGPILPTSAALIDVTLNSASVKFLIPAELSRRA